eukprot:CAMPEP_0198303336 /NCGR_PEP_ID=MMETSP1449-20131203/56833_1 /TAXON_ID=420275 /ORGANISM="Attheya septentrionalis, Strain CCMP2084" /LENGTH=983 /DNA_ID=CAMNT_0044005823 /DNA_START=1544 /DNA_END=4495 /DNA_ORIENTATION=+
MADLVQSYRRGGSDGLGYFPEFDLDVTYYNRKCDERDISTTDSSDLIVKNDETAEEAADRMLRHGALLFRNVLTNDTASDLRTYLESRQQLHVESQLPYHEKFFEEESRLALGIGVRDHASVAAALEEIARHPEVMRTLEAILGPDPSIVELSTMTALSGAHAQGLHTDSDYYGSSLLYSRTFYHSYSFFITLQDTTSRMGATTICPGTHVCANPDLEPICLNLPRYDHNNHTYTYTGTGAFEVSTNGQTGRDKGVLFQGDALLFNQNVWHRGATNQDPANPNTNRVVFILTFASSSAAATRSSSLLSTPSSQRNKVGDRRQLGLGTYYYQRWNMWGHTLHDLKDAATRMVQPWGAFRSLGLSSLWTWSSSLPRRATGHTWIEHFARQAANGVDFYTPYELSDLIQYLDDEIGYPKFLQGTPKFQEESDDHPHVYERFLAESIQIWVSFVKTVYGVALGSYFLLIMILTLMSSYYNNGHSGLVEETKVNEKKQQPNDQANWVVSFIRRIGLVHGCIGLIAYGLLLWIEQSDLALHVKSGDAFVKPFPVEDFDSTNHDEFGGGSTATLFLIGPTTVPETHDVLFGTRFDAPFLASFNRFLDFHPGNERYNTLVSKYAHGVPSDLWDPAVRTVVDTILNKEIVQNVSPRFLKQDYASGHWMVLSQGDAMEETWKRMTREQNKRVTDRLVTHLLYLLADSRFGVTRHTILSKRFIPLFVQEWEQRILFPNRNNHKDVLVSKLNHNIVTNEVTWLGGPSSFLPRFKAKKHRAHTACFRKRDILKGTRQTSGDHRRYVLQTEDRILGKTDKAGHWQEAKIIHILDEDHCLVKFMDGNYESLSKKEIQRYEPFVEGDLVEADFEGQSEWLAGIISLAHPLGSFDIDYDNGDLEEFVESSHIRRLISDNVPISFAILTSSNESSPVQYSRGDKVIVNYMGEGGWFPATVVWLNDDHTYYVRYVDGSGDEERNVPHNFIHMHIPRVKDPRE